MEPQAIRKVQNLRTKLPKIHHEIVPELESLLSPAITRRFICKSTCRPIESEAHFAPAVISQCHKGPAIVPIPPSIY